MKILKSILFILGIFLFLSACLKQKFFPDPYDPLLSRFTSKQFQSGTCYINDTVYINYWHAGIMFQGPSWPALSKIIQPNSPDSVDFSWSIVREVGNEKVSGRYSNITIRIPATNISSDSYLLTWNGKRFLQGECTIYLDWNRLTGAAGIYFVKVERPASSNSSNPNKYLYMSGLFEGNIGDSILIKNGRFDYVVEVNGF